MSKIVFSKCTLNSSPKPKKFASEAINNTNENQGRRRGGGGGGVCKNYTFYAKMRL